MHHSEQKCIYICISVLNGILRYMELVHCGMCVHVHRGLASMRNTANIRVTNMFCNQRYMEENDLYQVIPVTIGRKGRLSFIEKS